jgi:hypothetical protein
MVEAVAGNAPSSQQQATIRQFLLRAAEPDDLALLREADGHLHVYDQGHHVQVMARAAVLLRLATAACNDLIQQSGLLTNDLALWRNSFAVDRGLWDVASPPADAADLWSDVQVAVDDLAKWEATAPANSTLFDWRTRLAQAVETLTVTDRFVAWGL